MKAHPLIYLLVAGMAAMALSASAAEPDIAGTGLTWEQAPHVLKDPARKLYIATSKPLGYADGGQTNQYAHFDVWGKLVYAEPQRHGRYGVAEEWVALHLDCATMRYNASRYLMLDDEGTALVDARFTDEPKRIRTEWDDADHMKFMQLTADIAGRALCETHPD